VLEKGTKKWITMSSAGFDYPCESAVTFAQLMAIIGKTIDLATDEAVGN
jgi:hypothetical protein